MINKIMEEISLNDVVENISKLDKNDPLYRNKTKMIINNHVDKVYELIKDDKMEVRVAVLDYFFNSHPMFALLLIEKKDPKIIEAQLVLEKLKGIELDELKNNPDTAKAKISYMVMMTNSLLKNSSKNTVDYSEKIYKILHEYLSDKDLESMNEQNEENIIKYAKGFNNVQELLFLKSSTSCLPHRSVLINNLFTYDFVDSDILSNIFENTLTSNKKLSSFDYSFIIKERPELLLSIKGLYRKCNSDFFDLITSLEISEEYLSFLKEMIEDTIKCNSNDKEGIIWFLDEISLKASKRPELKEFIENLDIYKEYKSNIEKTYEESLNQLLNGNSKVDEKILYKLGKYEGFKEKNDLLLNKYMESNDNEYQKKLIIPLVVSLIEKLKKENDLDFETVFSTTLLDNRTLGSYNWQNNVLYVNPGVFELFDDMEMALVMSINTVFHEVRHAKQKKELKETKDLNYNALLMAMDKILSQNTIFGFYQTNYRDISFERDARECAYVDTMTYFKDHKNAQNKITKEDFEKYKLSDYIRKESTFNVEVYQGILGLFINEINSTLKYYQGDNEQLEEYINELKEFPVIFTFFDLDLNLMQIKPKDDKYFSEKVDEIMKMPDSLSKKEQLYSIKAFKYALKVNEYTKNEFVHKEGTEVGYNEEVIKEIEENVGQSPSK